jgi:hypothetical protein
MTRQTSVHERLLAEEGIRPASDRAFGLTFGAAFLVIASWPLIRGEPPRWWGGLLAMLFVSLALLRPSVLAPLSRLWMRLGRLLSHVTTPVVSAFLFYSTIAPMGLFLRLTRRDVLRLRREPTAASYWIERHPPGPRPDTMRNQF